MREFVEKKNISYHLNQVVIHKKFGEVLVKEIISNEEGKFVGKILANEEEKKFVFSSQFFDMDFDETSYEVHVNKVYIPQRKKERNYNKYRNHPFVKNIDYKESHILREAIMVDTNDDDDDDEEDHEDND